MHVDEVNNSHRHRRLFVDHLFHLGGLSRLYNIDFELKINLVDARYTISSKQRQHAATHSTPTCVVPMELRSVFCPRLLWES